MSKTQAAPEPLLTPQEVADILKLNVQTVRRLLRNGEIPHHKVGGSYRVSQSQLEEYLARTARHGGG